MAGYSKKIARGYWDVPATQKAILEAADLVNIDRAHVKFGPILCHNHEVGVPYRCEIPGATQEENDVACAFIVLAL
jgi:hypothetical protein